MSLERLAPILSSLIYILLISFDGTTSRKIRHPLNPFLVPSQKPPEFHLFAYSLQDSLTIEDKVLGLDKSDLYYQDEYVTRNGSDYTLTSDVESFTVACQAPYPIKWTFPHKEHIINLSPVLLSSVEYRISEFPDHAQEPNTKSFRIYLLALLTRDNFFSVTFSCEANEHPEKNSKAHFYSVGTHNIENQGSTVQVNASGTEDVVIPCRPADPAANILLDKQVLGSNATSWARLEFPNRYVTFSPKIGFTIKRSYVGYLQTTLFRCSLQDGDDDDYVFINITSVKDIGKTDTVFQSHSRLEGKAKAQFGLKTSKSFLFKCCSGVATKPPVVAVEMCANPTDCEFAGQALQKTISGSKLYTGRYSFFHLLNGNKSYPSDCAVQPFFHSESVVAICKGDNVDFSEIFVKTFDSVNKTHEHDNNARLSIAKSYEVASEVHNLARNYKIKMQLATPISLKRTMMKRISGYWDIGNFSNPIPTQYLWEDAQDLEFKYVEIRDVRDVYEGDPVHFACSTLMYVYSRGGHFHVNWKNGSRSVIEVERMTTFNVYGKKRNTVGIFVDLVVDSPTEPVVSKAIIASLEMVSVDCYAPVLGSIKWDKMSLALDFQRPVKPKFAGEEEEIVYFGLHETGHRINCELEEGKPIPQIDLTKDGKVVTGDIFSTELNSEDTTEVFHANETISNSSRTIEFPPFSHEMQGVYICTAENVGGKAVKTVKVFILEKHTHATRISVSVIFLTCVLLLGVGLCYLVQKRKVNFLRSGRGFRLF